VQEALDPELMVEATKQGMVQDTVLVRVAEWVQEQEVLIARRVE